MTVTAQKRTENLQDVPISIQAHRHRTSSSELNVADFDDYVKLPAQRVVSQHAAGPGFAHVYMRGVASGGNGNHSGPLPSVGMYLDEQPITTIQGALDIHIYDIARVEALAGPQGTLYGASSQAGTIRIITNKPDPTASTASYGARGQHDRRRRHRLCSPRASLNMPLGDNAAIRLVGWSEHDAGYIDNVPGTRTFPTSGITADNADLRRGQLQRRRHRRRARRAEDRPQRQLDDHAHVDGPEAEGNGIFALRSRASAIWKSRTSIPRASTISGSQAALTVQGKIGNFDSPTRSRT